MVRWTALRAFCMLGLILCVCADGGPAVLLPSAMLTDHLWCVAFAMTELCVDMFWPASPVPGAQICLCLPASTTGHKPSSSVLLILQGRSAAACTINLAGNTCNDADYDHDIYPGWGSWSEA
jgi:hypothetical protein